MSILFSNYVKYRNFAHFVRIGRYLEIRSEGGVRRFGIYCTKDWKKGLKRRWVGGKRRWVGGKRRWEEKVGREGG